MKIFLTSCFISIFFGNLFSQEINRPTQKKNPYIAGLLGIIPGAGHFYIKDYQTAFSLAGAYITFDHTAKQYKENDDYVQAYQSYVEFDPFRVIYSREYGTREYLGKDYSKISHVLYGGTRKNLETYYKYRRYGRLIDQSVLFELNPLFKYGSYTRTSLSNLKQNMFSSFAFKTMMYSSYAAYRDAGGKSTNESFSDLSSSVVNFKYLKDWKISLFLSMSLVSSLSNYQTKKERHTNNTTLINPNFHKSGAEYLFSAGNSFEAAVGEEAFFRGFLYNSIAQFSGKTSSMFITSFLFGFAHRGATSDDLVRSGIGFFLNHITEKYKSLRPAVFAHFWWNFFIFASEFAAYQEDPNYILTKNEVNFSPILYTYKF